MRNILHTRKAAHKLTGTALLTEVGLFKKTASFSTGEEGHVMLFNRCQTQLLLVLAVLMPYGVGGDTQCTMGSVCFPSGQVPEELTDKDASYYCCLEENTRRQQNTLPDGSQNCSCVDYFTAEEDMKEMADSTEHLGRMCNEGECEGIAPSLRIDYKFTYCCKTGPQRGNQGIHMVNLDSDKVDYLLCRCLNLSVPTPDPAAYLVPKTLTHNSTAESCSYDDGCQKYPHVKCQSSAVTFCCYGSRGMVTDNDAQGFTRCTCTNEMYGEHCAASPKAIKSSSEVTESCLTDCDDKPAEKKCVDSNNNTRCCSNDLNVVATQNNGSFHSCTCNLQRQMNCDADTSPASGTGRHLGDVMMMAVMAAYLVARQTEAV